MLANRSGDPARAKLHLRFILLLAPAVLALGAALIYLLVVDSGLGADEALYAARAAISAPAVYEGVLVVAVLLPGLRKFADVG